MSLRHIFRKYFLLTASTLFGFVILANFTLNLILKVQNDHPPPIRSPIFFARLLDSLGQGNRIKNLNEIITLNEASLPLQFLLLDEQGHELAGEPYVLPRKWEEITLPKEPLQFTVLADESENRTRIAAGFLPSARPPEPTRHQGVAGQIIKLPGTPIQYLLVHYKTDDQRRRPPTQIFALSFVLLIFSILLGVGVALAFIFRSLGKKVVLADSVIAELQKGNLKARFPIKKRDEFGAAMTRFNQMACEIELLVERLVNTEKSRMKLLQELAHDLRTPVASLKNLLETLQTRESSLDPKVKTELISLSVKEVDYFERLMEDLLILAQVSEPRYHPKSGSTDLIAILIDEAETAEIRFRSETKRAVFKNAISAKSLSTQGDALLLRRMFRNILFNAFSFAKTQVTVSLKTDPKNTSATIIVDDDGPGFTEDGLQSFGVRRVTRILGSEQNGRLSVGLGSVIVKTVAELHRGSVQVENRRDSTGKVVGARVSITLNLLA